MSDLPHDTFGDFRQALDRIRPWDVIASQIVGNCRHVIKINRLPMMDAAQQTDTERSHLVRAHFPWSS